MRGTGNCLYDESGILTREKPYFYTEGQIIVTISVCIFFVFCRTYNRFLPSCQPFILAVLVVKVI